MPIGHINSVLGKKINHPEVKGATMKVLVGPSEGWEDNVMRLFELEPGGFTPHHSHAWPHINYVVEGSGTVFMDGRDNPLEEGTYIFVPAGTVHQFKNTSAKALKFICIVPKKGHVIADKDA